MLLFDGDTSVVWLSPVRFITTDLLNSVLDIVNVALWSPIAVGVYEIEISTPFKPSDADILLVDSSNIEAFVPLIVSIKSSVNNTPCIVMLVDTVEFTFAAPTLMVTPSVG